MCSVTELSMSRAGAQVGLRPGPLAAIWSQLGEDLVHAHRGVACGVVSCGAGWVIGLNDPRRWPGVARGLGWVRVRLENKLVLVAGLSLSSDCVVDDDSRRRCHDDGDIRWPGGQVGLSVCSRPRFRAVKAGERGEIVDGS